MKLTNKSAVITIFSAALSPLLVCLLLALFGQTSGLAVILAVYLVFGLAFILVVGWFFSLLTKNSKNPLFWSVVSYSTPALLIDLAIIGIALAS